MLYLQELFFLCSQSSCSSEGVCFDSYTNTLSACYYVTVHQLFGMTVHVLLFCFGILTVCLLFISQLFLFVLFLGMST